MQGATSVQKADLDWSRLGFSYRDTGYRFRAHFDGAQWTRVENAGHMIEIPEGSQAINYGQQCFEGLKAFTTCDDRVVLFRPELNWERLNQSAERLLMAPVPRELFFDGLRDVIRNNLAYVPPYGHGAALYVRPLYLGIGDNLGLKPAEEFIFTIYVSPVGPYYKDGFEPIQLQVSDYDRAAPRGTGHVKVGGNYAAGMIANRAARQAGFNEPLYLDARTRTYIDEVATSNFFAIFDGDLLVTPKSESILESITRRSLLEVAESMGLRVEHRPLALEELADCVEAGCCGTAAVITPIGSVTHGETCYRFGDTRTPGPWTRRLYDRLIDIQLGRDAQFAHWNYSIDQE